MRKLEWIYDTLPSHAITKLKPLVDKYSKYYDLFTSNGCTPQKGSTDYDPKEEPEFSFTVNDPTDAQNDQVYFSVTEQGVKINYLFDFNPKTREHEYYEEHFMTHENCFKYLDQLPRGWHMFTTEEDS